MDTTRYSVCSLKSIREQWTLYSCEVPSCVVKQCEVLLKILCRQSKIIKFVNSGETLKYEKYYCLFLNYKMYCFKETMFVLEKGHGSALSESLCSWSHQVTITVWIDCWVWKLHNHKSDVCALWTFGQQLTGWKKTVEIRLLSSCYSSLDYTSNTKINTKRYSHCCISIRLSISLIRRFPWKSYPTENISFSLQHFYFNFSFKAKRDAVLFLCVH